VEINSTLYFTSRTNGKHIPDQRRFTDLARKVQ
jgi:hypothetical protein